MKDQIEASINALTDKATNADGPDETMKYSQAVQNLAHAFATLGHEEREAKKGRGGGQA